MSLVKDRISIRLQDQGQTQDTILHMLPLQGRGVLTLSDVDLVEILLSNASKALADCINWVTSMRYY